MENLLQNIASGLWIVLGIQVLVWLKHWNKRFSQTRNGRWIERRAPHAMGGISAKCSVCTKSVQYLGNPLNYCPNCGAKMDIKGQDDV